MTMATLLLLDAQTRRWLKREVSRRRKEKELHARSAGTPSRAET
jgi:hypothetical protein